jgi:4'-phosphopantetheinyl transferase
MLTSHSPNLTLSNGQVDVWFANLDSEPYMEEEAFVLLSSDERERAQRFRFPIHHARFVIRRGVLRTLLGRYLDLPPAAIQFSYGPYGKPLLTGEQLHFNLSMAGAQACFAFSAKSPVGIDIERTCQSCSK